MQSNSKVVVKSTKFWTFFALSNFKGAVTPNSGVFRIWQRGGHGERAEREPITGVWGRAPGGVQGQSPWSGAGGQSPPEAETLFASECSMETANSPIFSEICWKMAKTHLFI